MAFKISMLRPLALAALLTAATGSQAGLTSFTSVASFMAAVTASGVDTFDDLQQGAGGSALYRSAGTYAYAANARTQEGYESNFFNNTSGADVWLSTRDATDLMRFADFSSGVSGIGGLFFATDSNGTFLPGQAIVLTAIDSTGATATRTILNATPSSFFGFVSNAALTSLTVAIMPVTGSPSAFAWPAANNLSLIATPVPEPGSCALLLAGVAAVTFLTRGRSRSR